VRTLDASRGVHVAQQHKLADIDDSGSLTLLLHIHVLSSWDEMGSSSRTSDKCHGKPWWRHVCIAGWRKDSILLVLCLLTCCTYIRSLAEGVPIIFNHFPAAFTSFLAIEAQNVVLIERCSVDSAIDHPLCCGYYERDFENCPRGSWSSHSCSYWRLAGCSSHESLALTKTTDYGWTGWVPSPDKFCFNVLPRLQAANIPVPNEVVNGRSFNDPRSAQEAVFGNTMQIAILATSST